MIITITKIIYFKKFVPDEKRATSANFIVFGNSQQQFMAHRISNHPDFDQVAEVQAENSLLSTDPAKLKFVTLNKNQNNPVGISGNDVSFLVNNKKLFLLKQLYLEFGDLQ